MTQKKTTVLTLALLALLGTAYHFIWSGKSDESVEQEGLAEGRSAEGQASQVKDKTMSNLEIPYYLDNENNTIVEHMGYTLSYNSRYRTPNWVAYELQSSELYSGDKERRDEFTPDPAVKDRQAYDSDYIDSGYDRGHMAPAGDMKWSSQAMEECFYLSNVCPQNHNLNSGAWNDLEKQVRYECKYYDKIWVVCGPYFDSNQYGYIGEDHVKVPDGFFKALLARNKKTGQYVSIGFLFPNKACKRNLSLYVMTVDDLEKKVGMDLFYNLDDGVENSIESTIDPYDDWRITDKVFTN